MNENMANEKKLPRPEHPFPQMVREKWMNLNGEWEFEIDRGESGRNRKLWNAEHLKGTIIVPFCPESPLSGVGDKDFMPCVWYKKKLTHPFCEMKDGDRTLLHVGACDYFTEVYVNGRLAGSHIGGYTPFTVDLTDFLKDGENDVTLYVRDDQRSGNQPIGKQCNNFFSEGCSYTRTTGIWQTVWLEAVPASYIRSARYTTTVLDHPHLRIEADCVNACGKQLVAEIYYAGEYIVADAVRVHGDTAVLDIEMDSDLHLWEPGRGELYDLNLYLVDAQKTTVDKVRSYFGMREVSYDEQAHRFLINGKPVFMRTVLDQGFYPDGVYTAPTDEALLNDIKMSMNMGFNGARLHQKIFEPRFLYHCDRMGYLVWGEHANWGLDLARPMAWKGFLSEWLESVRRDYSHPALIGWCPLNETQGNQDPDLVRMIYHMTKAIDHTRPVIDCSGWTHVITDIMDSHDYNQDPVSFKANLDQLIENKDVDGNHVLGNQKIPKTLSFVSEYGGIWWQPDAPDAGWGYGNRPANEMEFLRRYKDLTEALLFNPMICGFCYTQLTDVEQEVNGLYYFDRRPKFDPAIIRAVNTQKAACETN